MLSKKIIFITFITFITLIIIYLAIKNNKPNYKYKNKYKENSIKIGKHTINDTRYIWGFEHVSGDEIELLKTYKISDDLIELYKKIKPQGKNVIISELGVGFDEDKEIKKVYFLEDGKSWGYGVKSDGKNVVYSKYEHKKYLYTYIAFQILGERIYDKGTFEER